MVVGVRPDWVCFVILAFGPLAPRALTVFLGNLASFGCPKRFSVPLIHWELRPNWVRFVILAFGALAPRPLTHAL